MGEAVSTQESEFSQSEVEFVSLVERLEGLTKKWETESFDCAEDTEDEEGLYCMRNGLHWDFGVFTRACGYIDWT